MRLARNNEGFIIKCQDIENGVVKSNEYYCNKCNNICFFISGSQRNCSYFKHKNDNGCLYYNNYNNNYEENIMSDFHRNWQEIFPNKNIEYKIEKNNKKHYADIYISYQNSFNICGIFEKEKHNLIIEIQYSAISYDILYEREIFYKSNDTNLLWIFDIKNKCDIEKIVLSTEILYKIRLKGKHYFTELFKNNNKANVLLDNGGINLYLIINNPNYDKDLLLVKRISRLLFLKELSTILNIEIVNKIDTSNNKIKVYDYESIIAQALNISETNKNELRYIFYVLETIPFYDLNNMFKEYDDINYKYLKWCCGNCNFENYWNKNKCYKCNYSKPFTINELTEILSIVSNKNKSILNLFVNFIEKNKGCITTTLTFGKYSGYKLIDISINYLEYLRENKNDKYCKCNNDICKNCKLYEDIDYVLRYSSTNIINKFTSMSDCEGIRYFDYTITDFVCNYNKNNDKKLLLQINNEKFKLTTNCEFIDDDD
jgi:hypothetical protein